MALFVPEDAPDHDNVTLSSETVLPTEQAVGAPQAVYNKGELNTVWLVLSIVPAVPTMFPSDATRKRTSCAALPVVEPQVTDTVFVALTPAPLHASDVVFIRTELDTPFMVTVQFNA